MQAAHQQTDRDEILFFDKQGNLLPEVPEGVTADLSERSATVELTENRNVLYALVKTADTDIESSGRLSGTGDDFSFIKEIRPGTTAVIFASPKDGELPAGASAEVNFSESTGERSLSSNHLSTEIRYRLPGGIQPNDATATVDFVEQLVGDANADHNVGPLDLNSVIDEFGSDSSDPDFSVPTDFNEDGSIGPLDFNVLIDNFGQTVAGYEVRQASSLPGTTGENLDPSNAQGELRYEGSSTISFETKDTPDGFVRVKIKELSPSNGEFVQVVPIAAGDNENLDEENASPIGSLEGVIGTIDIAQESGLIPQDGAGTPNPGTRDNPYTFDPTADIPMQFSAEDDGGEDITEDVNWALWPGFQASGSGNGFSDSNSGELVGLAAPEFSTVAIFAFTGDPAEFEINWDAESQEPVPANYDAVSDPIWIVQSPTFN